MGFSEELARFVVGTSYSSIPAAVVARARLSLLDSLGVMLAGADTPAARAVHKYVASMGAAPVSAVVGTVRRTAPPLAALANGTSGHALDYDDNSFLAIAHLGVPTLAAALAVGEPRRVSGQALLDAFILGYEAALRLSHSLMPVMYLRGYHPTCATGALAATVCSARLLKLSEQALVSAVGVTGSLLAGLRASFGTDTKALHAGWAAQTGVMATALASDGFAGSPAIMEARFGVMQAMVGLDPSALAATVAALRDGKPWRLLEPGIGIKLHPCNSAMLAAIQSTLELVKEHDIRPEAVDGVELAQTGLAHLITTYDEPTTVPEAAYSATHPLAVVILRRRAGIPEFSQEAVAEPAVAALRSKVRRFVHPDLKGVTNPEDIPACHVTIRLKDGRALTRFRQRPRAYPGGDPATVEEVRGKFLECAGHALPQKRAAELLARIDRLEEEADIGPLLTLAMRG